MRIGGDERRTCLNYLSKSGLMSREPMKALTA
nr:MAG TPA: hypothetical protein [Caudoviricetes sp.]